MRRVTLSLAAAAATLLAAPLISPAMAQADGTTAGNTGLMADFAVTQSWQNGFEGSYTVTNKTLKTVNSWSLSFDLPAGETVASAWNGVLTQNGSHYTITQPTWATPLAPGQSAPAVGVSFSNGTNPQTPPSNCTINNQPCAGQPADNTPPSAPGNLHVSGTGPGSVSLGWSAATDNQGVDGYHVKEGNSVIATLPSTVTSTTVRGLIQGSSHTFTVSAFDASANESPASAAVTGVAGSGSVPGTSAPYVDMGAFPTPSLPALSTASGLKDFTLAFIINGGQQCSASWFGAFDPATGFAKDDMDAIRNAGGDVRVSFGGANGTELAQSCTTVDSLAAQYQKVVDEYSLDRIDFDIEGTAVTEKASVDLRSAAIAKVQAAQRAKGRDLKVSLTLPVLPSGLTTDGVAILQSAKDAGVQVDTVNVMAMDFGDTEAPNPSGKMGMYAIQSGQSTQAQILKVWPDLTPAQAWAKVGITPMLGQNDNRSEVFTQADAQQLLTFAQQNHLAELAYWEMTRDANACTGVLSKCTNVPQGPYEFSKLFAGFHG